jgi:hypothetical protein
MIHYPLNLDLWPLIDKNMSKLEFKGHNCLFAFLILKLIIHEPRHDKTNIMGLRPASAQSDQDPCCSHTNPITSRETDSEQHGS